MKYKAYIIDMYIHIVRSDIPQPVLLDHYVGEFKTYSAANRAANRFVALLESKYSVFND